LDRTLKYVVFGGNLRGRAGRGYALIGQNGRGWLVRAGRVVPHRVNGEERWKQVRQFLDDLRIVATKFHLTVAALSRDSNSWKSLDEMIAMTRVEPGRRFLDRYQVRVYAPENYLALWRRFFAECLGFRYIPGGTWSLPPEQASIRSTLCDAYSVRVWLTRNNMTIKNLAEAIGWSRGRVAHQLTGRTRWNRDFERLVNEYARDFATPRT
jgi:hypothetical protein